MLLKSYRKEIFRSKCHPEHLSLHCHAHLDQDIGRALPYINGELGADSYTEDPPSMMLKYHGKLVALHSTLIAINALQDQAEADRILEWLKNQINEIWERRGEIVPRTKAGSVPAVLEILKLLPKTNCAECGQPTCMVFAVLITQGAKTSAQCVAIDKDKHRKLQAYLLGFAL